jgi:hypothetical protein
VVDSYRHSYSEHYYSYLHLRIYDKQWIVSYPPQSHVFLWLDTLATMLSYWCDVLLRIFMIYRVIVGFQWTSFSNFLRLFYDNSHLKVKCPSFSHSTVNWMDGSMEWLFPNYGRMPTENGLETRLRAKFLQSFKEHWFGVIHK